MIFRLTGLLDVQLGLHGRIISANVSVSPAPLRDKTPRFARANLFGIEAILGGGSVGNDVLVFPDHRVANCHFQVVGNKLESFNQNGVALARFFLGWRRWSHLTRERRENQEQN